MILFIVTFQQVSTHFANLYVIAYEAKYIIATSSIIITLQIYDSTYWSIELISNLSMDLYNNAQPYTYSPCRAIADQFSSLVSHELSSQLALLLFIQPGSPAKARMIS